MTTFSTHCRPSPTPHRSVQFALKTGSEVFDYIKGEQKGSGCTHGPEFDEILGDGCTNDQAVEWSVGQE